MEIEIIACRQQEGSILMIIMIQLTQNVCNLWLIMSDKEIAFYKTKSWFKLINILIILSAMPLRCSFHLLLPISNSTAPRNASERYKHRFLFSTVICSLLNIFFGNDTVHSCICILYKRIQKKIKSCTEREKWEKINSQPEKGRKVQIH